MIDWIYSFLIALLAFVTAIVLFRRYTISKDLSTRDWSIAFFMYFSSYAIATIFVGQWFVMGADIYFALQFLRQTFVSLLFIAVYMGIIRLLTRRKVLTIGLPLLFFILQTVMIYYFDYVLKNVQLGDIFHIIFFDIPFNFLIAVLFLKYYLVAKRKYALLISIAWFAYTLIVPVFFYVSGNVVLFLLSLVPMIIMLVGFLLYYKTPTGQALFEVEPVVEKREDSPFKYDRLKPGSTYLIEEERSSRAFDIFTDSIFHGVRGLCISRLFPPDIKSVYGIEKTPVLWLTHVHTDVQVVDPNELEQLFSLVHKFVVKSKDAHESEVVEKESTTSLPVEKKPAPAQKIVPSEDTIKSSPVTPAPVQQIVSIGDKTQPSPLKIASDQTLVPNEDKSQKSPVKPVVEVPPEKKQDILMTSEVKKSLETPVKQSPPKPSLFAVETSEKKPILKVEEHPKKTVDSIVDNFKEKAEWQKSEKEKSDEKKAANVVKKNKLGFTVIGGDDDEADTEHSAEMVVEPDNSHKSVILLDGLEYLINNNNFNAVLHVIQLLKDKISQGDAIFVLPVNPLTMNEQEISMLRQELEVLNSQKSVKSL